MSLGLNSSAGVKVNILQADELYDVKKDDIQWKCGDKNNVWKKLPSSN